MSKDGPQNDESRVVLDHLKHLPLLGYIVEQLDSLIRLAKTRGQLRHLYVNIQPGADYRFKFDAESLYVDNITNSGAITLAFDNEPLQFSIPANSARFIPCSGSKQFRIFGNVASGSVNAVSLNRPMDYN